jgi:hypothetical protein
VGLHAGLHALAAQIKFRWRRVIDGIGVIAFDPLAARHAM